MERARHAFGNSENLQKALNSGAIDAYDILFLDGDTEPKIGWVDKSGVIRLVDNTTDLSGVEAELATKANVEDVTQLEIEVADKANAEEVNAKINEIETALGDVANASYTHEKVKYEIANVPVGTLVNYGEKEIRVMCPKDSVFTKQAVGTGGDANSYYMTFKTYVYNDNVVGYKEHLGNQVDAEILTDLKTDEYGRRYQPTWLAIAKYDEATNTWSYYGSNSTSSKMTGWDYQIDFYDANGVMIASDSVRINLSNENCHSIIKPYYGVSEMTEVETKIETATTAAVESANAYTDAKIAEIGKIEVVEF